MAIEGSFHKYSALSYLQELVAEQCAKLPQDFCSLESWLEYKSHTLRNLQSLISFWNSGSVSGLSHIVSTASLGDDLLLESVDVHFDRGYYIPVHIYTNRSQTCDRPAILVCPGYAQPKNSPDIIEICTKLAEHGFIAAAMEYDGTGERSERPDVQTSINNIAASGYLIGISNVGLRVASNLAVLKYLKGRKDVDSNRIGITGLCQGAIVTWFTAAICDEFSVVAPLCGATTYEAIVLEYMNRQGGWSGISPYVYNMLEFADFQHLAACVAPRPLLVQNNIIDIHWPLSGFQKVKAMAENVYSLYGKSELCEFRVENAPHAYSEPYNTNIVHWFATVLK